MTHFDSCNGSAIEASDIWRDRLAAIERHEDLRRAGSPPIVLGEFYRKQLDRELWPSQAKLAADLNMSKPLVTRSIQASLLPPEVVAAFGGPYHISYRTAGLAMRLIKSVGRAVVVQRALTVPNTTPSAKKVISILATGVVQTDDAAKLRISLGANGKHLIIDGPHIDRVIPHLALVQRLLNVMLPSVLPPCADGIVLAGDRGLTGKRLRRER
ncbi:hypothetical protein [Burkholderia multivorans]|uniref:Uncharacterized protein n=1 Tax=Burkholderia multivorans TaxID=87883 RepID=A0AB37AKX3_9BURK|nr:hypothetical protein [Burkholderia multivorans]MBU9589450.1 hypothetical protein [Burkholderia multivorans]MCO1368745.1 hypothetical protein [Burkholderia multivorans]MCO1380636.1 hypothetical protein [Burkholderia multivorans]MDN8032502.1 hypothetical protein [Burkholderia multivorans]PRE41291.1 hypothetical protein C6P99_26520 [Burkholderia multivorans]